MTLQRLRSTPVLPGAIGSHRTAAERVVPIPQRSHAIPPFHLEIVDKSCQRFNIGGALALRINVNDIQEESILPWFELVGPSFVQARFDFQRIEIVLMPD